MVAGPFAVDKAHQKPSGSPTSSSAISSTSFFDSVSPHFSRRQPFKSGISTMPVPVPSSHEAAAAAAAGSGGPSPPSRTNSGDHGDAAPPRGYRHAPPPGYAAHYPPYGYPGGPPGPHYHGGPPPPHGYHPHHGPPPPGYHPHSHPPPNGYSPPPGYAAGGRPVYAGYGGYEAGGAPGSNAHGYPMQHSRDARSKTPPFQRGARPGSAGRPAGQQRASPVGGRDLNKSSSPEQAALQPQPAGSAAHPSGDNSSSAARSSPIADEIETDRLRQAALTEISPAQVEPIKTAFHFFVMDMRDSLRPMAEAEVRKNIQHNSSPPMDPYLVNSNLNGRLMKAWEDLSDEARQACMAKEEEDRRRFMEEEEIASRHCATLTARSKSPKTPERRSSNNTSVRSSPNPSPSPTASLTTANNNINDHAPSPVSRRLVAVGLSDSMDHDEKKMDDSVAPVRNDSYDIKEEPKIIIHHDLGGADAATADAATTDAAVATANAAANAAVANDDNDDNDGTNKRPSPTKIDAKEGGSPPKRNRLQDQAEGSDPVAATAEAS